MQQGNENELQESLFIHIFHQQNIKIDKQRVITLTHYTPWLKSQDDTPRSSMSIPSSVCILPAHRQHLHRPSP